jgi:hypothetical protein
VLLSWQTAGFGLLITAVVHAGIFLFPSMAMAMAFTKEKHPQTQLFDWRILVVISNMVNTAAMPVIILAQFITQCWSVSNEHASDPSIVALQLQILVYSCLAYRWCLRVGDPPWGWSWLYGPLAWWKIRLWYEWSFLFINYAMSAVGLFLVLICYVVATWMG